MDELGFHISKITEEIDNHIKIIQQDVHKNIQAIEEGWNEYVVKPISPIFDPFLQ